MIIPTKKQFESNYTTNQILPCHASMKIQFKFVNRFLASKVSRKKNFELWRLKHADTLSFGYTIEDIIFSVCHCARLFYESKPEQNKKKQQSALNRTSNASCLTSSKYKTKNHLVLHVCIQIIYMHLYIFTKYITFSKITTSTTHLHRKKLLHTKFIKRIHDFKNENRIYMRSMHAQIKL